MLHNKSLRAIFFTFLISIFSGLAFAQNRSYGQKLFEQNCLTCHSPGGYAQRFNFTSVARIFQIRDQLVESIVSNSMPPLQYAVGDGYPELTSFVKPLDPSKRLKIVKWLKDLKENSQTALVHKYLHEPHPNLQQTLPNSAKVFRIKDNIQFVSQYSSGREQTSTYKIDLGSIAEIKNVNSLLGYKVLVNSNIHHFQITNDTFINSKYKLISWVPFFPKMTLFPPGSEIQIDLRKPIFLDKHTIFSEESKVLNNELELELLLAPQISQSKFQAIGFNSSVFSMVFKNSITKYSCFDTRAEVLVVSPHMHSGGDSLEVKLYKPLFKNELKVARFYGWTGFMQDRYMFKKSMTIQPSDCLKITCHFKPASTVQYLGWESSEEMCALNMQTK